MQTAPRIDKDHSADFIRLVNHPLKFRMFLFAKLPSAFFAGVRVRKMDEASCLVTVPYKWFSQNPFRSTYFACLSMAAEMSTGVLAMAHIYRKQPPVSMLVVKVESQYLKKAIGVTTFTCSEGLLIRDAVQQSISTGEGKTIRVETVGRNQLGEKVAEFWITWSFKGKSS